MITGIGTDIIDIERVQAVLERQGQRFVERILTAAEQAEYRRRGEPVKFLANRFAGKEAVAKALGTGIAAGVTFQQIEILPDERGAPVVSLTAEAARLARAAEVWLSLSDERRSVVAFAVLQSSGV